MRKRLLFVATLVGIAFGTYHGGYAMFIASPRPRHKLSPHSSHNVVTRSSVFAIPEEDQKTETEQKKVSQSASAASQSVETNASELVRKAEQDLGSGARACDEKRLAAALSVVKDANVLVDAVNNRTALHKIVETVFDTKEKQQEQVDCIALLLKYGAKIDQQDKSGFSPLHVAASCANLVCVKFLVSQGAAVDSRRFGTGWTPLFVAVVFSGVCSTMEAVRPFIDTIDWLITCGGADYRLNGGFESGANMGEDTRTPFEAARRDEVKVCIQQAAVVNKIVQAAIQSALQEPRQERKVAREQKEAEALQVRVMKERVASLLAFDDEVDDDADCP
jgi:hypothetical protein